MLRTIGLLACLAVIVAGSAVLPVTGDWASAQSSVGPVGLSLFFQNGTMPPITLSGGSARYLQEIDIVATSAPSLLDQGISPLMQSGDFASLNWDGIAMVEED